MEPSEKLLDFFRREFRAEECSGFQRLSRIPGTYVTAVMAHYRSLSERERISFIDCSAHWAYNAYGFVIGAPRLDHTKHPYFTEWSHAFGKQYGHTRLGVPLLRATVQQYKADFKNRIQSRIALADFQQASATLERSIRAPELRKRVREALRPLGYRRQDHFGCWCQRGAHQFCVSVSYGGGRQHHQLSYAVARPEFGGKPVFSFERTLGFALGNWWDYITRENLDDCLLLFADLVEYSYGLPERIEAEAA